METLEISYEFPFGKGVCYDPSLCIFRVFRKLMETGEPPGRISHLVLKNDEEYRFLGSLCSSSGNRILFFPDRSRTIQWQSRGCQLIGLPEMAEAQLDHVTLEPDRTRFHYRYYDARGNSVEPFPPSIQRRFRTLQEDQLTFWFSMSIKGPLVLRPVPAVAKMTFKVAKTDSTRRVDEICSAVKNAKPHLIQINPDSTDSVSAGYLHVVFVLDQSRDSSALGLREQGRDCALSNAPKGRPLVRRELKRDSMIPIRTHPVAISGLPFPIQVAVGVVPTELSQDSIFGTYA